MNKLKELYSKLLEKFKSLFSSKTHEVESVTVKQELATVIESQLNGPDAEVKTKAQVELEENLTVAMAEHDKLVEETGVVAFCGDPNVPMADTKEITKAQAKKPAKKRKPRAKAKK